jgi:hypothetical protein
VTYTFRPGAVVTLDGRDFSAAEAGLAELDVTAALGGVGEARLVLWPRSRLKDAAPGASLALRLGAAGEEAPVFTGTVDRVTRRADAVVIEALEPAAELGRRFLSRAYLNQAIAAIVRDLADPVTVAEAEADLELGQYGVENRRSVWWHLRDLALLAGCDLLADAEGGLLFRPRGRGATHAFRYGADLLGFHEGDAVAAPAPAQAAHGSASSAGTDKWHWIAPDPFGAAPEPGRVRGALASEDAASAASDAARARAAARAKCGRIAVWGRPALRPGDAVDLQGLPGSGGLLAALPTALPAASPLGGSAAWRAVSVRHAFGGVRGFVTSAELEGAAAGGGGLFP